VIILLILAIIHNMQTWLEATKILNNGGVAVIPTDTLYGLVGSAFSTEAVERIYRIKGRDDNKPCIILITSYEDLDMFGVEYKEGQKLLHNFWPGKVSVILPIKSKSSQNKFTYLHKDTDTLSFRMIGSRNKNLFNLINTVGPLVAPSANPQGLEPAENITQAKKYFGDSVDFYVSSGTKKSKPSTLVLYKNGKFTVLRQGAVIIK
jgi:L-threonylcarbamoyladenylate synthase